MSQKLKSKLKPSINDALLHCPEASNTYVAIDSQVCFHRCLFAICKTVSVCYRSCWATGSTNQNWLGARLLPMAVLIYSVVCVHSCRLLGTQHHCLWPNGREGLPLACPPAHPLISETRDITVVVKTISKTSSEHCMAELAMKH